MENRKMALAAARLLNDKKADDIMLIDITGKSSFADYLVIASGSSGRQAEAMADDIEELLSTKIGRASCRERV